MAKDKIPKQDQKVIEEKYLKYLEIVAVSTITIFVIFIIFSLLSYLIIYYSGHRKIAMVTIYLPVKKIITIIHQNWIVLTILLPLIFYLPIYRILKYLEIIIVKNLGIKIGSDKPIMEEKRPLEMEKLEIAQIKKQQE